MGAWGSFDDFVSAGEDAVGNSKPEGLGGLEVDAEIQLSGEFHWQIRRPTMQITTIPSPKDTII